MVKHTQKICPQKLTNCLSVFDHFVGLALKGLTEYDLFNPFRSNVPINGTLVRCRRCSLRQVTVRNSNCNTSFVLEIVKVKYSGLPFKMQVFICYNNYQ